MALAREDSLRWPSNVRPEMFCPIARSVAAQLPYLLHAEAAFAQVRRLEPFGNVRQRL